MSGIHGLVAEAERQTRATIMSVPITWHVAEESAATAIRTLLHKRGYGHIQVLYTPFAGPVPKATRTKKSPPAKKAKRSTAPTAASHGVP